MMSDDEKPTTSDTPLTAKERLFIAHYFGEARGNGTKAMRLAGYAGDDNTLASSASRMLRKHKIAAEIERRMADIYSKAQVLHVLADQANPDRNTLANFFRIEEEERVVSITETVEEVLPPTGRRKTPTYQEIKRTVRVEKAMRPVVVLDLVRAKELGVLHLAKSYRETDKGVSIELYDQQAANKQIGEYHKMWTTRTESVNTDVDLSSLSDSQVDRLAAGESLLSVLTKP